MNDFINALGMTAIGAFGGGVLFLILGEPLSKLLGHNVSVRENKNVGETDSTQIREEPLISFYDSTDVDITVARALIKDLSKMGIILKNEHKNLIVKKVTDIYGLGSLQGQARAIPVLKKKLEGKFENLPKEFIEHINKKEKEYFDNYEVAKENIVINVEENVNTVLSK